MTETSKSIQIKYQRLFWILLISVTLVRLGIVGLFGLSTDESHYVLYARNLACGYFDHPPMVAFLGALTTFFGRFGGSIFLFRFGPVICWFFSAVILRLLALALYGDERTGFWSLVFFRHETVNIGGRGRFGIDPAPMIFLQNYENSYEDQFV